MTSSDSEMKDPRYYKLLFLPGAPHRKYC